MISLRFDMTDLNKTLTEAAQYTDGFLDGFMGGGIIISQKIAAIVETMLGKYIDSIAAGSPGTLHHVYEWGASGSSGGRLFNISANADAAGVTVVSTFSQSSTVSDTATVPFYNKAEIMEAGTPITIEPVNAAVLHFFDGGEEVFAGRVTVTQPGGPGVQGSFERTFNKFFSFYFSQGVLHATGLQNHLENPYTFETYFPGSYGTGISAARQWLMSAPGGETVA